MASGFTAVVDYGSGNLRSVEKAVAQAARSASSVSDVRVIRGAEELLAAERVVLPGVGAFGDCMRRLAARDGMIEALNDAVLGRGTPFLGICVGMQIMATRGLEHGEHEGLNWIAGEVVRLAPGDPSLKVPHMGWNTVRATRTHPVLAGFEDGVTDVYFVHSFSFCPAAREHVFAETEYGRSFVSAAGRDNILGVQFHPEKSQRAGITLLENFLRWRP